MTRSTNPATRTTFISLCLLFGAAGISAGCHSAKGDGTANPTAGPGSNAGSDYTRVETTSRDGAGSTWTDDGRGYEESGAMAPMPEAEADAPMSAQAGAYQTEARERRQAKRRPGLGTQYGEQYYSAVRNVGFTRRSPQPEHVFQIWYDDSTGVRNAAREIGWSAPQWSEAMAYDSGLSVRLLDQRGRTLRGAKVGTKTYALGSLGDRYTIGVYNDTEVRQEVVASVDGLDVISGDSASFGMRGYVVEPYSSVQIDGWRTSESNVAAFRFSSVESSYAGRTGRARNVGVIGVAFFSEAPRYTPPPPNPSPYDPWRDYANPFPAN